MRIYDYLASVINFVVSFLEILLLVRLFLRFFGANPNTPFVQWVYDTSAPVLAPFRGIFPSPEIQGQYVLEFSTIFAIVVYAFIGFVLVSLMDSMSFAVEERQRRRR